MSSESPDEIILHGSDAQVQVLILSSPRPNSHGGIVLLSNRFIAKAYRPDCLVDTMKTIEIAHSLGIRTPRLIRSVHCPHVEFLIMERVEGMTLEDAWPQLGWSFWLDDRFGLPARVTAKYVEDFLAFWTDFRSIKQEYRKSSRDHAALKGSPDLKATTLVLTHHDLAPRNIMIDVSGDAWLIDWDYAGFYPVYFEYASMSNFMIPESWGFFGRLRWWIVAWLAAGQYEKQRKQLCAIRTVERNSTTTSSLRLQRNFVNVYYTGGGGSTASCLPESYYSCVVHQSNPIFSSAAACPPGYEPMCTFVAVGAAVTAAPTVSLWTVLGAGDAAIGCCPSPYSCVSTLQPGETSTVLLLSNFSQTTKVYANAQTSVSVYAFKLIYASTQFSAQSSTASTQHSTPPPTESAQRITPARSGLSLGQKVAIGVCVPLAVLLLLLGLLFMRRRYKKRVAGETPSEDLAPNAHRKSELEGFGMPRLELDASKNVDGTNSGDASRLPVELPNGERPPILQHEIAELPGSDMALPDSPPGRNSPILQRKPVAGSR
ncbi:hypothetical protein NQ176_g9435 [Zarea fungicola]|uniref:Uncharacterized protein n=1 Tax=Zarea fungicola TaxID=93591 RepID=A0ACC1MMJ9_9HYPO|nr:hypothetical protein NQ176_g9435 [Lecanicillium fungicola]